jgi:hypothetical protein
MPYIYKSKIQIKGLHEDDGLYIPMSDVIRLLDDYKKQLILNGVSKRYDAIKYTPPFRVGRKQGKAVLDSKGIEVVFFIHSEEQSKMYCDYLNNG